jgi:uncharacterized membrane protein YkvA (DUF1232 family)
MPLPDEAVRSTHLQHVLELPLALDRKDEIRISKLSGMKSQLVAGTLAFVQDIVFLYRLLRHPHTPWHARAVLFLPVMYLFSPIQLIPNFIPVIGQIDDVVVIWIAKKIAVVLVDANTREECKDAAVATKLSLAKRMKRSSRNVALVNHG